MQSPNIFPLDDDVVDHVLSCLPDYTTLSSFRLTCRIVNAVFKRHPQSIQHAIAENLTGSSCRQALRVAQAMSQISIYSRENHKDHSTNDIVKSLILDLVAAPDHELCGAEMYAVEKNTRIVRRLEDLFSWRVKDRASATTILSPLESLRLHRAMYRIWFMAIITNRSQDITPVESTNLKQPLQTASDNALSDCSLNDLRDMMSVVSFLLEISTWSISAALGYHDWLPPTSVVCDPSIVLESFESLDATRLRTTMTVTPFAFFLMRLRSAILSQNLNYSAMTTASQPNVTNQNDEGHNDDEEHEEDEDRDDEELSPHEPYSPSRILDNVVGESDICQECFGPGGTNLWNETNWHYLRGLLPWSSLIQGMKGRLSHNRGIAGEIRDVMAPTSFTYDDLLSEIHEIRRPSYTSWQKTNWLCLNCYRNIFREHLHIWWYRKLVQRGEPLRENCWYAYNRRTQIHKSEHASKLNHLCEPTRGD